MENTSSKISYKDFKKFSKGYGTFSKYGNIKTEYNGVMYDSKREASRRAELDLLVKAGKIKDLERQVRIPAIVNGVKVFTYIADFVYFDNEKQKIIVEDVKGMVTAVFRLKQKVLEAQGYSILITK